MIKLKFVNIADSSDIITIPFFKGYISNFNDADHNIKNDYNNKMTVYEKTYNMYEKMDLPTFDEVPTKGLDKTYEWVKNSLLKCLLNNKKNKVFKVFSKFALFSIDFKKVCVIISKK